MFECSDCSKVRMRFGCGYESRAAEVSDSAFGYAGKSPVRRSCLRKSVRIRPACGGGAIFTIVGYADTHVGEMVRANNGECGSSR